MGGPTFLDLAASIDRVLHRNIQWPLRNTVFADSPVTVTVLDRSTMCDAILGAMVVNLPDATTCKGMFFEVKKTDIGVNTVTVQSSVGGQTIDGAGTKVLNASNDFVVVESDGANYKVVALEVTSAVTGGAVFYTIKKAYLTTGVTTLNPVNGTTINFTVAVDGECFFSATGVFAGLSGLISTDLAIYVDGTLLAHSDFFAVNGSGGDRTGPVTQEPNGSRFLTAGPHTCHLVAGQVNIALQGTVADPCTLTVIFPAASASTAAPTPKAATLVVHPVPGVGDFTTIQAALTAIGVLGGGYILVREGTYNELLTYPVDIPVVIKGCGQNTVLAPTAAGVLFDIPNGLTTTRTYVIEDLQIQGNPAVLQTGFKLDDVNGFGNFELRNVNGTGLSKFANWTQYDTAFLRQSCIFLYNSVFQAISGGSTLVTAPNPAGSYLGAVAIRASEASAFSSILSAGVTYGWTANADADFWLSDGTQVNTALTQGIAMNGFLVEDTIIFFYGTGSASFGGNGWGNNDFIRNTFFLAFDATTLALVDFLLNVNGSDITESFFDIAINCTFIGFVTNCEFLDPISGSAHPAVQLNNQKSVVTGNVIRNLTGAVAGWPQGGVKLAGAGTVRCKVHHNFFEVTLVGPTITETGGSDFNIINGNTGETNGTGLNITGTSTTVNDAAKADAAASTTAALVAVVSTILNPKGLQGTGTVKNTGGVNSMDVKESFTDAFGTVSTLTTTVLAGNTLPLNLDINIGTGFPPYVSYKVEVIDTVAASHTTYVVHFTSQGATQ